MKRWNRPSPWVSGVALGALALFLLSGPAPAQRGAEEGGQQSTAKEPAKAKPKAPRGRLPAYFSKLVSEQQREEIYRIQASYLAKINELKKQLQQLFSRRDQEVDAVLTDEQLAAVKKKRAEAQARRAKRRKRSKPAATSAPQS